MGAWGYAIFSNDFAADLRDDWRQAMIDRVAPEEATAALVSRLADEGPAFWIALAAAQHETGHLLDDVRDRAVAAIAAGGDLEEWDGDVRRAAVLQRLAERLLGPQPAPKRLRAPRVIDPGVDVGDVILLREPDLGREGLVAVVGEHAGWPRGARWPIVEYLLWDGGELPSRRSLARRRAIIDESLARWGEPQPWRADVPMYDRGCAFGPHVGEIVARGIRRPSPAGRPAASTSWDLLTARLAWPQQAEALRLTRRSSRRERADRVAALGGELERMQADPLVPSFLFRRLVADLRTLDPERAAAWEARAAAEG